MRISYGRNRQPKFYTDDGRRAESHEQAARRARKELRSRTGRGAHRMKVLMEKQS